MRHFSSDHHFDHANIIGFCDRPFETTEEMNEAMIERWNAQVAEHDEVWILGDLCMGKLPDSLQYVSRLNGHKILLPGNHDYCWPGKKGWRKWATRYVLAGIDEVLDTNTVQLTVAGQQVLACHFPYRGDHYAERFAEYRPEDRGMSLLHGHIHEKWKVLDNQINVGVDVWNFYPASEEELAALLA